MDITPGADALRAKTPGSDAHATPPSRHDRRLPSRLTSIIEEDQIVIRGAGGEESESEDEDS